LGHEVGDLDDEVADHGKVAQRLHAYRARLVPGQERRAGELRLAVDGHAATPADAHPAGPAIGQRAVEPVLDVVEAVEDRPVLTQRDVVPLGCRFAVRLRPVPGNLKRDGLRHPHHLPYTRSPGGQRVIVTGRYSTRGGPSAARRVSE